MLTVITLSLLLSYGSMLLVSALNFHHTSDAHGMTMGLAECPFMAHEETICPMTAFDHLTVLRHLFETIVPSIVTFTLTLGGVLVSLLFASTLTPLLRLQAHTFLRWRQRSSYAFPYRLFQELFARGILHPKLFPSPRPLRFSI